MVDAVAATPGAGSLPRDAPPVPVVPPPVPQYDPPGVPHEAGAPVAPPAAAVEPRVPPLRDIRLWITVGLVGLFAIVFQLVFLVFTHHVSTAALNLMPLAVFLVPVLYAASTFGLSGGLVVAAVSALAAVPYAIVSARQGNDVGAWGDGIEVVVLFVIAYFVGRTVLAEREAREAAEQSRQDHILAEIRYRDLFDTNSQPIFLVDFSGVVAEANVAAETLFGHGHGTLNRTLLPDIVGAETFAAMRTGSPVRGVVGVGAATEGAGVAGAALMRGDPGDPGDPGAEAVAAGNGPVFRPIARSVTVDGQPMLQVMLLDVTEDARRHQRARAYAADVVQGQEDERRRIAQELHDGPLQTLVHICRMIDGVAAAGLTGLRTRESSVADNLPTLAKLRNATEQVVAEIRQISRGLRPTLLDDLGLTAALERLCDDVERRAGVAAALHLRGPLPALSPAGELTVYRIAQEALSNVDHHAGASSVDVTVSEADHRLFLRVSDDGEGFDTRSDDAAAVKESLGLPGMTERAALVGGTVQVRSSPGEGTTVVLSIPLDRAADAADA